MLLAAVSLAESPPPWWRDYHTVVSHATGKEAKAWELGMMAERSAWATGWYGAWWIQQQLEHGTRWDALAHVEKFRSRGVKNVFYFDAGEFGEFVGLVKDQKLIRTQWDLPFWKGEQGEPMWFGINGFYSDNNPFQLKNYKDFGLPAWTMPDGSRPASLYDFACLSFDGKRDKWDYSGLQVPPNVAQALKLDEFLKTHSEPPPGTNVGRIVTYDHSNPFLLRDFQTNVAMMLTQKPAFIHFDNYADNELTYPQWSGFGPWSLEKFREFIKAKLTETERRELGIDNPDTFDLRQYITEKPFRSRGLKWHFVNAEWQDDPVWNLYVCSKLADSQQLYRGLYDFCKTESRRNGAEVVVAGNDIPTFPGGTLVGGRLDLAHFEYHIATQYGPIRVPLGLPPRGRLGGIARLGAAISNVGWCWPTVYVPKALHGPGHENLHKVLAFDGLANKGVLDYNHKYLDGFSPGSDESAAFINCFIKNFSAYYGSRRALADVGLVFPGQSLLGSVSVFTMDPSRSLYDYLGWSQALTELHAQWDVLPDDRIDAKSLKRFPVIVLASAECLSDSQIEALTAYVRDGGRLIVSGKAGTRYSTERFLWKRKTAPVFAGAVQLATPGKDFYTDMAEAGREKGLPEIRESLGKAQPLVETDAPKTIGVFAFAESDGGVAVDVVNYAVDPATDLLTPAKPCKLRIRPPAGVRFASKAPVMISPSVRARIANATPQTSPTPWNYREEKVADWKLLDDGSMEVTVPAFDVFMTLKLSPTASH